MTAVFKTDSGGKALSIRDAKISVSHKCSAWSTKLNSIGCAKGDITIVTYSLPDTEYIENILNRRNGNLTLVFHEKFLSKANVLKRKYKNLKLYPMPDVHAKMVLIEPRTVLLSSANFGKSGWFEQTIGIHSEKAYEYYMGCVNGYISDRREYECDR